MRRSARFLSSSQTWRGLDAGRKELLLPLHDDRRLRDAAQHVSKFNLTQTKTTADVRVLLTDPGEPPAVRVTGPVLLGRMKKLAETLGGAAMLKKVRALSLEASERKALVGEVDKVREVLTAIAKEVRERR